MIAGLIEFGKIYTKNLVVGFFFTAIPLAIAGWTRFSREDGNQPSPKDVADQVQVVQSQLIDLTKVLESLRSDLASQAAKKI